MPMLLLDLIGYSECGYVSQSSKISCHHFGFDISVLISSNKVIDFQIFQTLSDTGDDNSNCQFFFTCL